MIVQNALELIPKNIYVKIYKNGELLDGGRKEPLRLLYGDEVVEHLVADTGYIQISTDNRTYVGFDIPNEGYTKAYWQADQRASAEREIEKTFRLVCSGLCKCREAEMQIELARAVHLIDTHEEIFLLRAFESASKGR